MRVNVYSSELPQKIERVTKTVDGVERVGLRFFMSRSAATDRGVEDESAITFWATDRDALHRMLCDAQTALWTPDRGYGE